MTAAAVICTWMEPKSDEPTRSGEHSPQGWWRARLSMSCKYLVWVPADLTLDALWEVEDRLTEDQLDNYGYALVDVVSESNGRYSDVLLIHATAEQKTKALAAGLRPIVEKA